MAWQHDPGLPVAAWQVQLCTGTDCWLRFDAQHLLLARAHLLQIRRQDLTAAYLFQWKWGQGFSLCAAATTTMHCETKTALHLFKRPKVHSNIHVRHRVA